MPTIALKSIGSVKPLDEKSEGGRVRIALNNVLFELDGVEYKVFNVLAYGAPPPKPKAEPKAKPPTIRYQVVAPKPAEDPTDAVPSIKGEAADQPPADEDDASSF